MEPIPEILLQGGAAVAAVLAFGVSLKWIIEARAKSQRGSEYDVLADSSTEADTESRYVAKLTRRGVDTLVAAQLAANRTRLKEILAALDRIEEATKQSGANHELLVEIDKKLELLDRDLRR